ncbi:MAG: DUF4230 domain-containing protein [Bacteroidota bacterium]|nr:DUF4230 domain-containing protein [Bacteroidota bacterium]
MQKLFIVLLLLAAGCGKKNKDEEKPSVLTLKEMSDLATVEYTVTKVIKASDNKTWFKVGDRKILMSCEAHIKAGIDMSAIDKNSFTITGKNIEVSLPQPKVISISIPPEGIKTEFEEVGILRDKFKSQDRDALAAQAEQQIRNSIDSLGILNQAKVNTSTFVTNFLKRLGYENISINFNGTIPKNSVQ